MIDQLGRKGCQKKRKVVSYQLFKHFFQKYFVVHDWSAVKKIPIMGIHSFSFFVMLNYRSEFWDLPSECALPWEEIFDDPISPKPVWKSFSGSEMSKTEEDAMDALLVEACDEMDPVDAFLLEAADKMDADQFDSEMDAEDQFLLEAAGDDSVKIDSKDDAKKDPFSDDIDDIFLMEAAENLP